MKKHTGTVMHAMYTTTFFLIQERRFFCAFLKHQASPKTRGRQEELRSKVSLFVPSDFVAE